MTSTDIVMVVGIAVTLLLGVVNFLGGRPLVNAQSFEAFNKSITLANNRALDAEQRAFAAENRVDELEKRIEAMEKRLSYRLTFDVILGSKPEVERAEINELLSRESE